MNGAELYPFEFDLRAMAEARTIRRAARRAEIESAFRRGLIVWQKGTFWSTAGVIHTWHGVRADAVFIEPYQSDPVYLAEHLENREFGFGFETVILRTEVMFFYVHCVPQEEVSHGEA